MEDHCIFTHFRHGSDYFHSMKLNPGKVTEEFKNDGPRAVSPLKKSRLTFTSGVQRCVNLQFVIFQKQLRKYVF